MWQSHFHENRDHGAHSMLPTCHSHYVFPKSDQGTIAQRCLSQKTVLPIMFLVMPTESHYVWTLVDPSLAIPSSSDTIDTLIPAILLYGSYKITHFLIKHFFLRATGIGCPPELKEHMLFVSSQHLIDMRKEHLVDNLIQEIKEYGELKEPWGLGHIQCKFEKCSEYYPKRFRPWHDKNCSKVCAMSTM